MFFNTKKKKEPHKKKYPQGDLAPWMNIKILFPICLICWTIFAVEQDKTFNQIMGLIGSGIFFLIFLGAGR
tara:strand:- start:251 stop:463 length:213 start_codon:yes stop_codon:yes gene_type:complete